MFYGGIALAAIGCILLIAQLMGMKKQKKLAEDAARISDVAAVAVISSGKASKGSASKQPSNPAAAAYDSTVKLNDAQLDMDDRTVKLGSPKTAAESWRKPSGIKPANERERATKAD